MQEPENESLKKTKNLIILYLRLEPWLNYIYPHNLIDAFAWVQKAHKKIRLFAFLPDKRSHTQS